MTVEIINKECFDDVLSCVFLSDVRVSKFSARDQKIPFYAQRPDVLFSS